MLRPRFHVSDALSRGETLELSPAVSNHITRVLRLREGKQICLFDGTGVEATATIVEATRKSTLVNIEQVGVKSRESALQIVLAIAMSRGDRMDTIVQKATELGVQSIVPLVTDRTELRLSSERVEKKVAHWRNVAISACEQCGRNTVPEFLHPQPLKQALARFYDYKQATKLILHPEEASTSPLDSDCRELILLIGPEGGFSEHEVADAKASGFRTLTLGPRVLRTETAPLVAIAIAQARWGDLLG
ncbi:MAG: 16S rRNA (uracil(1498)-N(3))-methyltransferase [Pseudomonadota bacterium]